MKATIILCSLVTLCGFAVADVEDHYTKLVPEKFNVISAIMEIKKKTGKLLQDTMAALTRTQVFLAMIQKNIRDMLHAKLSDILYDIRSAVDASKAQGKDAEECFTGKIEKLQKIQNDTNMKIANCINNSLTKFSDGLNVTTALIQEGHAATDMMANIYVQCAVFQADNQTKCISSSINRACLRITNFNQKYKFQSTYRKMLFDGVSKDTFQCVHLHIVDGMAEVAEVKFLSKSCISGIP